MLLSTNKLIFEISGHHIEAASWLGGSAPAVVALHEGLGSVGLWRSFPRALAASSGRDVYAYSRYGNGLSDVLRQPRPVSYMHDEARVLGQVLDALGLERAVLYGHSDGASIALLAAAYHHDRVIAVVVEAPHVFVEVQTLQAIQAIGERYRGDEELRRRIARHHNDGDATFFGWNDIWLHPDFAAWNITGDIAGVRVPVLGLQGNADPYGTPAQLDAIERAGIPIDKLILNGCAHAPHQERPTLITQAVTAWLNERAP